MKSFTYLPPKGDKNGRIRYNNAIVLLKNSYLEAVGFNQFKLTITSDKSYNDILIDF